MRYREITIYNKLDMSGTRMKNRMVFNDKLVNSHDRCSDDLVLVWTGICQSSEQPLLESRWGARSAAPE